MQGGQDLVARLSHHLGARIVVLVDAVAEAHQAGVVLLVLHAAQEARDVLLAADLVQHVDDGLVGAAVAGAPQRGDAGGDAGERVGARGAGEADRRGRGVLLVVGMEHQDAVVRLLDHRIDLVLLSRDREHHAQEVG